MSFSTNGWDYGYHIRLSEVNRSIKDNSSNDLTSVQNFKDGLNFTSVNENTFNDQKSLDAFVLSRIKSAHKKINSENVYPDLPETIFDSLIAPTSVNTLDYFLGWLEKILIAIHSSNCKKRDSLALWAKNKFGSLVDPNYTDMNEIEILKLRARIYLENEYYKNLYDFTIPITKDNKLKQKPVSSLFNLSNIDLENIIKTLLSVLVPIQQIDKQTVFYNDLNNSGGIIAIQLKSLSKWQFLIGSNLKDATIKYENISFNAFKSDGSALTTSIDTTISFEVYLDLNWVASSINSKPTISTKNIKITKYNGSDVSSVSLDNLPFSVIQLYINDSDFFLTPKPNYLITPTDFSYTKNYSQFHYSLSYLNLAARDALTSSKTVIDSYINEELEKHGEIKEFIGTYKEEFQEIRKSFLNDSFYLLKDGNSFESKFKFKNLKPENKSFLEKLKTWYIGHSKKYLLSYENFLNERKRIENTEKTSFSVFEKDNQDGFNLVKLLYQNGSFFREINEAFLDLNFKTVNDNTKEYGLIYKNWLLNDVQKYKTEYHPLHWIFPTLSRYSILDDVSGSPDLKNSVFSICCMINGHTNKNSATVDLNAIQEGSKSALIIDRGPFGEHMVIPKLGEIFENGLDITALNKKVNNSFRRLDVNRQVEIILKNPDYKGVFAPVRDHGDSSFNGKLNDFSIRIEENLVRILLPSVTYDILSDKGWFFTENQKIRAVQEYESFFSFESANKPLVVDTQNVMFTLNMEHKKSWFTRFMSLGGMQVASSLIKNYWSENNVRYISKVTPSVAPEQPRRNQDAPGQPRRYQVAPAVSGNGGIELVEQRNNNQLPRGNHIPELVPLRNFGSFGPEDREDSENEDNDASILKLIRTEPIKPVIQNEIDNFTQQIRIDFRKLNEEKSRIGKEENTAPMILSHIDNFYNAFQSFENVVNKTNNYSKAYLSFKKNRKLNQTFDSFRKHSKNENDEYYTKLNDLILEVNIKYATLLRGCKSRPVFKLIDDPNWILNKCFRYIDIDNQFKLSDNE